MREALPSEPVTSDAAPSPESRAVYSVSQLNRLVRRTLEDCLEALWVEGEISNLSRPASGHLYFSLKDDSAQLRCAMFRNRNRALAFVPEHGVKVIAYGRISLYEARGDYQLIVEDVQPAGSGALHLAYEALKRKLHAEGLFDEKHKRPLPAWPCTVGIVTSPSGAAIRDVLTTLKRRFPALRAIVYPVPVQGEEAAGAIVGALALAGRRRECDVLILARGGGSLEDLWPFNDEAVARAVRACPLPLVTGIGHEIDTTIADLAADRRAATPTAAAELVSPDQQALRSRLARQRETLLRHSRQRLQARRSELQRMRRQLREPRTVLVHMRQRLDDMGARRERAWARTRNGRRERLHGLRRRLSLAAPERRLRGHAQALESHARRLHRAGRAILQRKRERLRRFRHALQAVSPQKVLERGYAIVRCAPDGTIVRDAARLRPGALITARFHRGEADCRVETVRRK